MEELTIEYTFIGDTRYDRRATRLLTACILFRILQI